MPSLKNFRTSTKLTLMTMVILLLPILSLVYLALQVRDGTNQINNTTKAIENGSMVIENQAKTQAQFALVTDVAHTFSQLQYWLCDLALSLQNGSEEGTIATQRYRYFVEPPPTPPPAPSEAGNTHTLTNTVEPHPFRGLSKCFAYEFLAVSEILRRRGCCCVPLHAKAPVLEDKVSWRLPAGHPALELIPTIEKNRVVDPPPGLIQSSSK